MKQNKENLCAGIRHHRSKITESESVLKVNFK